MIPSILSSTPPWPGNKSLVSLTLAFLFKYEIERSPNCEVKDINNTTKIKLAETGIVIELWNIGIKNKEKINDPIEPEIVLFGLILVNFFPLKIFPNINPPISDATEINKEKNKKNSRSGLSASINIIHITNRNKKTSDMLLKKNRNILSFKFLLLKILDIKE